MKVKSIISSTVITILIGVILFLTGFSNPVSSGVDVNSVYQVYLDGKKIGVIASDEELYNMINEDQKEIKTNYNVDNVYPPNGFEIVKYNTYSEDLTDTKEVYSAIKEEKSFTVKGYVVNIKRNEESKVDEDDEDAVAKQDEQLYVLTKDIFDEASKKIVTTFIEANKFEDYLNDTQQEVVDIGETIEFIDFDEDITIRETYISTDEKIFTDVDELSQYLLFGTNKEQEKYTVKKGDTIETISLDHKLNVQEFLIANPRFTGEDNLLAIGEDVVIALIEPVLTLVYEKKVIEDVETDYDSTTKYDSTKYSSYRAVTQKGEKGIQRVTKSIRIVNGEENQGAVILGYETLKEPVNEIITRGKRYGSGGNVNPGQNIDTGGKWAWPTNSPSIVSSEYGYRWGRLHDGMDITGTGWGSPIYAALDGEVVFSGKSFGGWASGICVVIDHKNGYYTVYAHLSKTIVKTGQKVSRRQKIAEMGNTGKVSPRPTKARPTLGTHVHFSVFRGMPYQGGSSMNPRRIFR